MQLRLNISSSDVPLVMDVSHDDNDDDGDDYILEMNHHHERRQQQRLPTSPQLGSAIRLLISCSDEAFSDAVQSVHSCRPHERNAIVMSLNAIMNFLRSSTADVVLKFILTPLLESYASQSTTSYRNRIRRLHRSHRSPDDVISVHSTTHVALLRCSNIDGKATLRPLRLFHWLLKDCIESDSSGGGVISMAMCLLLENRDDDFESRQKLQLSGVYALRDLVACSCNCGSVSLNAALTKSIIQLACMNDIGDPSLLTAAASDCSVHIAATLSRNDIPGSVNAANIVVLDENCDDDKKNVGWKVLASLLPQWLELSLLWKRWYCAENDDGDGGERKHRLYYLAISAFSEALENLDEMSMNILANLWRNCAEFLLVQTPPRLKELLSGNTSSPLKDSIHILRNSDSARSDTIGNALMCVALCCGRLKLDQYRVIFADINVFQAVSVAIAGSRWPSDVHLAIGWSFAVLGDDVARSESFCRQVIEHLLTMKDVELTHNFSAITFIGDIIVRHSASLVPFITNILLSSSNVHRSALELICCAIIYGTPVALPYCKLPPMVNLWFPVIETRTVPESIPLPYIDAEILSVHLLELLGRDDIMTNVDVSRLLAMLDPAFVVPRLVHSAWPDRAGVLLGLILARHATPDRILAAVLANSCTSSDGEGVHILPSHPGHISQRNALSPKSTADLASPMNPIFAVRALGNAQATESGLDNVFIPFVIDSVISTPSNAAPVQLAAQLSEFVAGSTLRTILFFKAVCSHMVGQIEQPCDEFLVSGRDAPTILALRRVDGEDIQRLPTLAACLKDASESELFDLLAPLLLIRTMPSEAFNSDTLSTPFLRKVKICDNTYLENLCSSSWPSTCFSSGTLGGTLLYLLGSRALASRQFRDVRRVASEALGALALASPDIILPRLCASLYTALQYIVHGGKPDIGAVVAAKACILSLCSAFSTRPSVIALPEDVNVVMVLALMPLCDDYKTADGSLGEEMSKLQRGCIDLLALLSIHSTDVAANVAEDECKNVSIVSPTTSFVLKLLACQNDTDMHCDIISFARICYPPSLLSTTDIVLRSRPPAVCLLHVFTSALRFLHNASDSNSSNEVTVLFEAIFPVVTAFTSVASNNVPTIAAALQLLFILSFHVDPQVLTLCLPTLVAVCTDLLSNEHADSLWLATLKLTGVLFGRCHCSLSLTPRSNELVNVIAIISASTAGSSDVHKLANSIIFPSS